MASTRSVEYVGSDVRLPRAQKARPGLSSATQSASPRSFYGNRKATSNPKPSQQPVSRQIRQQLRFRGGPPSSPLAHSEPFNSQDDSDSAQESQSSERSSFQNTQDRGATPSSIDTFPDSDDVMQNSDEEAEHTERMAAEQQEADLGDEDEDELFVPENRGLEAEEPPEEYLPDGELEEDKGLQVSIRSVRELQQTPPTTSSLPGSKRGHHEIQNDSQVTPVMRKKSKVQSGSGKNHQYHHTKVPSPGTKAGRLDREVVDVDNVQSPGSGLDVESVTSEMSDCDRTPLKNSVVTVAASGRAKNRAIPERNRHCYNLASVFLRAKVVAENPWPMQEQGKAMIAAAWQEARESQKENLVSEGMGMDRLEGDEQPDLQSKAKMWTSISKTRSHWASAARKTVASLYGLTSKDGTPNQIKCKVGDLVNNKKFMAVTKANRGGVEEVAYFHSPALWKFLDNTLIQYPTSIARHPAVLRAGYFRPLRPCTIVFACSVLQCALQAYAKDGTQLHPPPMFETGEYSALHNWLIATWNKLHINRRNGFINLFGLSAAAVFNIEDNEEEATGDGTGEEFGDSIDDLADLLPAGKTLADLGLSEV